MDELKSMAVSGGSDLFAAGTYKISDGTLPHPIKSITSHNAMNVTSMRHRLPGSVNKVSTITLSGTSGTAYLSYGANKLLMTFATDLYVTLTNFVAIVADAPFYNPRPAGFNIAIGGTAQVERVTLTGTSGTANITAAGGLTKVVTFNATLIQTAADFVLAHTAAYAAVGITIAAANEVVVFSAAVAGKPFTAPVITNATGDAAGTVAHTLASATTLTLTSTSTLFPTPTITNVSGNLTGTVVTTGADGLVAATKLFFGDEILAGTDIYMEYPVEEIVLGSGSAIFHFIN